MKIKNKTIYGGLFVDKHYLILEDGTQVQVPFKEWESYKKGDNFDYISNQTVSCMDELAKIAQKHGLY